MRTRNLLPVAILIFGLAGCTSSRPYDPYPANPPPHAPAHGVRHGHGPPPHAPAHGYRAKAHGRDLEYDAGRGVYVVIGLPGIYWHSGWFYRLARDRWQRSGSSDGPWHDSRWGDIPVGLRGGKGGGPGHGRGKGHGHGRN